LFLVTAYFLVRYVRRRDTLPPQHRMFLYRNLITPYLFIFLLYVVSVFLPDDNVVKLQSSPVDHAAPADTSNMWRAM